jgi:hypothetical protein
VLFLNFEKFEVKSLEMVEAIRSKVAEICEPLGHKVEIRVDLPGYLTAQSALGGTTWLPRGKTTRSPGCYRV